MFSINQINTNVSVGSVKNSKSLGKNEFLKLLITQLENQNPLKPMDNTQFISQMAQFTSLEQTTNLANSFDNFEKDFSSTMQLQAASLVGKEVSAYSNELNVISGKSGTMSFILPKKAMTYVKIFDSKGNVIDIKKLGWIDGGKHSYVWSATNSNGVPVPDGTYTYEVDAIQEDGTQVQLEGVKSGKVSKVKFENGKIYVTVNGVDYSLSNITSISNT